MYKIKRLYNTLKYLKFIQIRYQIFYTIRKTLKPSYRNTLDSNSVSLSLTPDIPSKILVKNNTFEFLNISHTFDSSINWNFPEFGLLWTYNLVYFDYLNQLDMSQKNGLTLINDFIDNFDTMKEGREPYPISLRGINWIKFVTKHEIKNQKIDDSLYAQYCILFDNLEYHLMGNHLLENLFSLLYGAYYFQDIKFYKKIKEKLFVQLQEQILKDGAHFEQSPMYHQILLVKLLDCINLLGNNHWQSDHLLVFLINKASQMLGWLNNITLADGSIPLLNDSANKIAPITSEINDYASRLNQVLATVFKKSSYNIKLEIRNTPLTDSGYRIIKKPRYECVVDIGEIAAAYIPGHAHSDTFNFELYLKGKPFISDTGISTYERNEQRITERSTISHNTVELEGLNQSEVWASYRLADRAKIVQLDEKDNTITATHNGYKKRLNALHQREFSFDDQEIKIVDTIFSDKEWNAIARLHFHPSISPVTTNSGIQIGDVSIEFHSCTEASNHRIKISKYLYSSEYNKLQDAYVVEVFFTQQLTTNIKLGNTYKKGAL